MYIQKILSPVLIMSAIFFTSVISAESSLKVVTASMTKIPPIIDGKMDEECWGKTEVRTDFTSVGEDMPLARETRMRFLYDEKNLYVGFELFWEDIEILKKGVAEIIEKYGSVIESNTMTDRGKYANIYGVEIFIDPGPIGGVYYQILFNAAGQITGNMRMDWENFKLKPVFKGNIEQDRWVAEVAIPLEGLKDGEEFGLNVCRNDETYYGIWKQVWGPYHTPSRFGRLLLGDYQGWWEAVRNREVELLKNIEGDKNFKHYRRYDPFFEPFFKVVKERINEIDGFLLSNPPVNRDNFEQLYLKYSEFHNLSERLKRYYETLTIIVKTKRK